MHLCEAQLLLLELKSFHVCFVCVSCLSGMSNQDNQAVTFHQMVTSASLKNAASQASVFWSQLVRWSSSWKHIPLWWVASVFASTLMKEWLSGRHSSDLVFRTLDDQHNMLSFCLALWILSCICFVAFSVIFPSLGWFWDEHLWVRIQVRQTASPNWGPRRQDDLKPSAIKAGKGLADCYSLLRARLAAWCWHACMVSWSIEIIGWAWLRNL